MKITKIKINKLSPYNGLLGFCSFIVDGCFFIGNVAIFSRKNRDKEIRLVFPERSVEGKVFKLCYPLKDSYAGIEQLIRDKFYEL